MRALISAMVFCTAFFASAQPVIVPGVNAIISGYVYTDPFPAKMASMPIAGVKVLLGTQIMVLVQAPTALFAARSLRPATRFLT